MAQPRSDGTPTQSSKPIKPKRKHSIEPKPFAGLTQQASLCALCAPRGRTSHATASGTTRSDAPDPPTSSCGGYLPGVFARIRTVPIAAGWGWATCAPTAIPAVARGVNSTVRPAKATFQSITVPCSMASASRSTSSCIQVVQVLAPGCVPLFLTDGFKEYTTALLTHLRPVGAAATPPGHRPRAQAALDAAARSCSMRR